ncbi:NUMOD4 domain-containing protein [Lactococcus sp.]
MEQWKKIVDAPDYEVSSGGKVRNLLSKRFKSQLGYEVTYEHNK